MMIKIGFLFFFTLVYIQCFSQSSPKFLKFENLHLFDSKVEISSICYKDNTFYLPAERLDSVFVVNIEGDSIKLNTIIHITGLKDSTEIEASFIKNDTMFLVDEYYAKIYTCNLKTGNATEVTFNGIKNNIYKSNCENGGNDYGFEGITYNQDKNLVYLLREKDPDNKNISSIYIFELTKKQQESWNLDFLESFSINKTMGTESRFSDLIYHDKKLYLLETKPFFYQIQKLTLNKNGMQKSDAVLEPFCNLTCDVNKKDSSYNSNLEGITVKDSSIYIVSDNGRTKENPNLKKTAFIKIDLHK